MSINDGALTLNLWFFFEWSQVKEKEQAQAAGRELEAIKKELEHAKQWKGHFESTQAKMLELELEIKELSDELNAAIIEKDESKEQAKNEKGTHGRG